MSYEYQVTLQWEDGGTQTVNLHDYNGENILLSDGFSKTETLHKDLKPVQDKANFSILFRTSLANTLLTIDPDTRVTVDIDQLVPSITSWRVNYILPGGGAEGTYDATLGGGGATGTFDVTLGGGGATGTFGATLGGNVEDIERKASKAFDVGVDADLTDEETGRQYFRELFGDAFYSASPTYETTAVDWFYGTLRPVTSWMVTNEPDGRIDLEALDNSERLKRKFTSAYKKTSATVSTVITEILVLAGYSVSEYNVPTIPDTVDYILEKRGKNEYWEVVRDILFGYGYLFYFDGSGVFQTYDFSVSTTPSVAGVVNDNNIVDTLEVERELEEHDGVAFKWYETLETNDYPLVSRNRVTFLSEPGRNEQTYPEVTSSNPDAKIHSFAFESEEDEEEISNIVDYSNLRLQYEIEQIEFGGFGTERTRVNYTDISPGYTGSDPYTYTGLVEFQTDDSDAVSIQFKYDHYNQINPSATTVDLALIAYRVVGDVTYTVEREFYTSSSLSNPWDLKGKYVYSVAAAERTANILERRIANSQYSYTLQSESAFDVGDYVTLQSTDLNIDTTARIIKRGISESRRANCGKIVYQYELEGVGELGTLFGQVAAGIARVSSTSAASENAANVSRGLNPEGNVVKTIKGYVIDQDDTPNQTGLYMTRNYLGFWDNPESEWVVRLQNDGGVGKAHFGGATDNYLDWDGTDLTIKGAASISGTLDVGDTLTVGGDIQSDDYVADTTGFLISGGSAEFNDITVRGTVEADTGAIGGWDITATSIESTDDTVKIRSDEKRLEVLDGAANIKVALGYLDGVSTYTATDFGLYVATGNVLDVEGDATYGNGDWVINSDGAYVVKDAELFERARFGSLGGGDIGLDIGGVTYGDTLGGGAATGTFGTTLGGGGSTGTFGPLVGGGGATFGRAGMRYSLADDKLYLSGTLVGVDGEFSGSLKAATITGGNIVVESTGAIQSSNYVADTSGWRIDSTGVEIDDGTFRGDIIGATITSLADNGDSVVMVDGEIRFVQDGAATYEYFKPGSNLSATAIATNADIIPETGTLRRLGGSSNRWQSIYTNNVLVTSGAAVPAGTQIAHTSVFTSQSTSISNSFAVQSACDYFGFFNSIIKMPNIPTSATGLDTGDLYNDGGTLKVAP